MVAGRLGVLSKVVADAGENDITQGEDLLTAAEDVEAMSAVVGMMSLGDAERGLALGRVAGELSTLANIVDELEMPILAAILDDRGALLQGMAVEIILRAAAERGLSQLMAATGGQIADMGVNEIDEGLLRVAASDMAAERSAELAAAGADLADRGAVEMAVAGAAADLADDLESEGVTDVEIGAAELGAAAALDEES